MRDDLAAATIDRPRARWVAARWSDLPGWNGDRVGEFWPAFLRSCERPAAPWLAVCAAARQSFAAPPADAALRDWLQQHLRAYRIESLARDPAGSGDRLLRAAGRGLARAEARDFAVALYGPPADLATRKPYWTRQQLETLPAAQKSLRGSEIAWVRDRLDALVLQVQGSGRLAFVGAGGDVEGRCGSPTQGTTTSRTSRSAGG